MRMKRFLILVLFLVARVPAQSNTGELSLALKDPAGLGVQGSVDLVSEANQYRQTFVSDEGGFIIVKRLPFGVYTLRVDQAGFNTFTQTVEIRSRLPVEFVAKLGLLAASVTVQVTDEATLIDPHRTGTINRIGSDTIQDRVTSLPGRSIVDLVDSQPGWIYEGNSVLHPRGSEYGTQFLVDGIPLLDNRSPGFGPEIEGDDVESLSIYTASFPAEFGRKLSGVVEVETAKKSRQGLHATVVAAGGSYDTLGGYLQTQYGWGKNSLTASIDGSHTDHYLNPPVAQNFTNAGTTGDYSLRYERDLTDKDRVSLVVRHGLARFNVPNEQLQQAAGQRQDRSIFETMGIASYQHIFTSNVLADLRVMVRDSSTALRANPQSTPIVPFQDRGFAEGYVKGSVSVHHRRHEIKTGVEIDSTQLRENFSYLITNPARFEPGVPLTFSFSQQKWDLEQSAFLQDQMRLGPWTVNAGLRWDHYQLLVNKNDVSPRLSVARYFARQNLLAHVSYDRIFQTPFFENILLSSSPKVGTLNNGGFLQLPVKPSFGNFYEAGISKALFDQLRLEVNLFERRMNNFADDDLLLNTGLSFPISFQRANLYGAETKLEIPHWGKLSGYLSHSYIVGSVHFPVTGGLFLGADVPATTSGRFWNSQDQRNTLRVRGRYEFSERFWFAAGGDFGSGLPVSFTGTVAEAVDQYGQQVVDRVNFARGRLRPSLAVNASFGALLWKSEKYKVRVQADGTNFNNRLNLIDFAGLFSGNAIAPARSYALRLTTTF
jgi:hypothetical protein